MAPPGLTALGAKGSACDRLRLTGRLRAFALGSYIVTAALARWAPFRAPFFMPPLAAGLMFFLLCSTMVAAGFWEGIGGKLYSRRLTAPADEG